MTTETKITEAAKVSRVGPKKIMLTLITPGQGSSGYYSPETLETAATERAFPKGTFGMVNHATEKERAERPEGDLRNLIWVTLEDAHVNEEGALVAEARVVSAWRDFIEEVGEFIGASISASAVVSETAEGRVVERIIPHPFNTVDAVTVAGRGGKPGEILEAARVIESRSILAEETTSHDVEAYISYAVRKTHSDEEGYGAWLDAHDDTYAYFRKRGGMFRQTYTRDGVNVTLTGEIEPVLRRTEYDPVTTETVAPATVETIKTTSPALAEETKKSTKEIKMAEIAEERLQTLEESHGQLQAIKAREAEKDKTIADLQEGLARSRALNRAQEFAKTIINGANSELSEAVVSRIVSASVSEATLPLTEKLQLDTDALTETVNQAREAEETYLAQLAKENGLGQVRGIGDTKHTEIAEASTDDIRNALKGA